MASGQSCPLDAGHLAPSGIRMRLRQPIRELAALGQGLQALGQAACHSPQLASADLVEVSKRTWGICHVLAGAQLDEFQHGENLAGPMLGLLEELVDVLVLRIMPILAKAILDHARLVEAMRILEHWPLDLPLLVLRNHDDLGLHLGNDEDLGLRLDHLGVTHLAQGRLTELALASHLAEEARKAGLEAPEHGAGDLGIWGVVNELERISGPQAAVCW